MYKFKTPYIIFCLIQDSKFLSRKGYLPDKTYDRMRDIQ